MIRRRVLGALALAWLTPLCGCDLSGAETEEAEPLAPPKQRGAAYEERVIRGWLLALGREDYEGAAQYFAPGALVDQGDPYRLKGATEAKAFNASLPCRADLLDVEDEKGPKALASFGLREGPGGPCSGVVKVRFTIRKGRFTEWRQFPEQPEAPGEPA